MTGEQRIPRRYALTKVSAGDYLLPSNDGRHLWRIIHGDEQETTEPGDLRHVKVWQAWRYRQRFGVAELPDDFLEDWSSWELMDSWCATRGEAISRALRAG